MKFHFVGLDLSLAATGWAVIREGEKPRHGLIPTGSVDPAQYYPLTLDRIRRICSRIIRRAREGLEPGDIMVVAIEGPAYNAQNGQEHARGGLWWLVYHLLSKEATVVVVPPKSAKSYMTSNGNANKAAMVAAVQRAFPALIVTDDNEADAIALAAMVARELDLPQEVSTQRVRPAALDGVKWPDWITQRRQNR